MAEILPGFEPTEDDDALGDPDDFDDLEVQSGLGRGLAAIIPTLADLDAPKPKRRRRGGGVAALLGPAAEDEGDDSDDEADGAGRADAPADPSFWRPIRSPEQPDQAPERGVIDDSHVPAPSAVRQLRDDLVGALLDGLANTMALDLCAYLHEGPGEAPHLFLQAPSMDAIGPARTYAVLDGLRIGLEKGRSEPAFATGGFEGISVATVGEGSRGLWAVARSGDITAAEREVATRFCRSFGRAVHQLDGAAAPSTTLAVPVAVAAHRARDSVLAEVQVRFGDQIRPGHGRAATRVEAITRAVTVAAGRHVSFRYASEVAHQGEHAAVVLLESDDHAVALGSALSPASGGVATALAAIRALDGLGA